MTTSAKYATQSPMKKHGAPQTVARVLVALEIFLAGGLAALLMVRRLLLTIMDRLISGQAQGEILNVLDHLLPYYVAYFAALVVVGILAATAWFAGRQR